MKNITPPFLTSAFSENGKQLKKRFSGILDTKRKKAGIITAALIICLAAVVCGIIGITPDSSADGSFLIAGMDDAGRADAFLLCTVKDNDVQLTQIPDNLTVNYGEEKVPLSLSYALGTAASEVGSLMDINTPAVLEFDYESFEKLIDAAGGIDFDVPVDMDYSDPYKNLEINLSKGRQHLNGENALNLVRYRYNSPDAQTGLSPGYGDTGRLEVQQSFCRAFINKLLSGSVSPAKLYSIYRDSNISTNMSGAEIKKYIRYLTKHSDELNITFDILKSS